MSTVYLNPSPINIVCFHVKLGVLELEKEFEKDVDEDFEEDDDEEDDDEDEEEPQVHFLILINLSDW